MRTVSLTVSAGIAALVLSSVSSAVVPLNLPGPYQLHNHPDGNAATPFYGARFDELVNVTGNTDIFTLNFDGVGSDMRMTITANTIHIFGTSAGGRDIGSDYANDVYKGIYQLDFTYTIGVGPVPGDDDFWVAPANNHSNFGTLKLPGALGTVNLTDEVAGGYSLRIGNEDDDAGHRGFAGISGWGWMSYKKGSKVTHIDSTDWLFTATPFVPTPGTASLLAVGALALARRRR